MAGVARDKRRVKQRPEVDIITPHGAEVTVTADRAATLLARSPIRMVDNVQRRYVLADSGESNVVPDEETRTGAQPPRRGTGANTGGDA